MKYPPFQCNPGIKMGRGERTARILSMMIALLLMILTPIMDFEMIKGRDEIISTLGPIDIQNEDDLSDQVAANDWKGNGTLEDPYVIQDVHINYNGGNLGISLKNIDSHIVLSNLSCSNWGTNTWFFITIDFASNITVKDCDFSNCPSPFTIDNSKNILIENCTFIDVTYGIRALFENSNFTVTRCLFESCGHGIIGSVTEVSHSSFRNCSNAADLRYDRWTLHHCTFNDNYESVLTYGSNFTIRDNDISAITCAISLRSGSNAVIRDNVADSDLWSSIRIWGLRDSVFYENRITKGYFEFPSKDIEDYTANSISENNTVGGRPVHTYLNVDMDNTSAESGFGQLIAANVSWFSIDNLTVTDVGNPISMAHSSNISISDNAFQRCRYAIDVTYCEDVLINRNNVSDCWFSGVYLGSNQRLDVRNNRFYNNNYSAVSISGGKSQIIQDNSFRNNNWSAVMLGTKGALVRDNIIDETEYYGIVVHPNSAENRIHGNHIKRSGYHGIFFYQDSSDNMVYGNNISLSNDAGIYIYRAENNLIQYNDFYSNRRFGIFVNDTLNARIYSNKMYLDGLHYQYYNGFNYPSGRVINNNTLNGKPIRIYYGGSWSGSMIPKDTGQVVLLGASDLKISGIDFSNACSSIVMKTSSNIIVEECTFQRNSICGILVTSSPYAKVYGCNFTENSIGIITDYGSGAVSEQCDFRNNEFYRNERHGVRLQSKRITVRDSLFIDNGHSGVFVKYAQENIVTCNTFKGNKMGVTLYKAIYRNQINRNIFFRNSEYGVYSNYEGTGVPNEIILNIFIENNGADGSFDPGHIQAFDKIGCSDWYSETQLGNYWSDWLSPDTDENDIVDVPYPIGGGIAQDIKPMTRHPFIVLSRPIDVMAYGGNGNVTLHWAEPDINRGQTILGYSVYRSNVSGEGILIDRTGNVTYYNDTTVKNNERYFYFVRAINEFGPGSKSLEVNVWTDGEPPALEILDPLDGAYIDKSRTTVRWECEDNIVGISHYVLFIDGGEIAAEIVGNEYTVKDMGNGDHTIELEAYDNYFNRNVSTIDFTVDYEDPTLRMIEPLNGSYHNTTELEFRWTGEDVYSGIKEYRVRIDGGEWMELGTNETINLEVTEEGEHSITVVAIDLAGNSVRNSSTFLIDLRDPVLDMVMPLDGSFIPYNYFTAEWTATDTGSGLGEMSISLNGEEFLTTDDGSTHFIDDLPEGENVIVIRIYDMAGNIVERTISFTVDTRMPVVTSYSPTGDLVEKGAIITIEFSEEMSHESLNIDAKGIAGNIEWENNTAYFKPLSLWEQGEEVLVKVTGTDLAGNPIAPLEWSFKIDDRGRVYGILTDENGNRIASAVITLDGNEIGSTDSSGEFDLHIPSGTHTIGFSMEGYHNLEWTIEISPEETEELSGLYMIPIEKEDDTPGGEETPVVLYAAIGLVVLLVVIVIVALLIVKTRNKQEKNEELKEEPVDPFQVADELKKECEEKGIYILHQEDRYLSAIELRDKSEMGEALELIEEYNEVLTELVKGSHVDDQLEPLMAGEGPQIGLNDPETSVISDGGEEEGTSESSLVNDIIPNQEESDIPPTEGA